MVNPRDLVSTLELDRVGGDRVYFVSDIHLGDGSHADIFLEKDEHFLDFLDEVEAQASALVIVGDFLDFEQAWYFSRIVRAHQAVITRLTRLAERMQVVYVYGNHDPEIILFRDILKLQLCDKVVVDGHILALHGYEFDSYVGQKWEESSYWTRALGLYERVFRTWVRLPLRDNYTLSNRVAHLLLAWLATAGNVAGALGRWVERPELGGPLRAWVDFWARGVLGDPMGITRPAIAHLEATPAYDTIICGHNHVPGVLQVDSGKRYVNLGSWSFGNSQYGVWDGVEFQLRDWISGRVLGDENYRPMFVGRADRSYLDWFADEYLGYLRFKCGEEALREGVRPRPWVLEGPSALERTHVLETRPPHTE